MVVPLNSTTITHTYYDSLTECDLSFFRVLYLSDDGSITCQIRGHDVPLAKYGITNTVTNNSLSQTLEKIRDLPLCSGWDEKQGVPYSAAVMEEWNLGDSSKVVTRSHKCLRVIPFDTKHGMCNVCSDILSHGTAVSAKYITMSGFPNSDAQAQKWTSSGFDQNYTSQMELAGDTVKIKSEFPLDDQQLWTSDMNHSSNESWLGIKTEPNPSHLFKKVPSKNWKRAGTKNQKKAVQKRYKKAAPRKLKRAGKKSALTGIRFQDPVRFSLNLTKSRCQKHRAYIEATVAVMVVITNRLLTEMFDCHGNTKCTYTSILSSQIKEFSLKEQKRKRLDPRLKSLAAQTHRKYTSLQLSGNILEIEQFLLTETRLSVMKSEIMDYREKSFKRIIKESGLMITEPCFTPKRAASSMKWSGPEYAQMDVGAFSNEVKSEQIDDEDDESLERYLNDLFREDDQAESGGQASVPKPNFRKGTKNMDPSIRAAVNRLRQAPHRIRFQDKVKFSSSFKQAQRGFDSFEKGIAVILNVTNRFMMDVFDCHTDTGNSYTSIVNSQIKVFNLVETARLEARLRSSCGEINSRRKELCRSGSKLKRELFLVAEKQIGVLTSEVMNLSNMAAPSETPTETANATVEANPTSGETSIPEASLNSAELSMEMNSTPQSANVTVTAPDPSSETQMEGSDEFSETNSHAPTRENITNEVNLEPIADLPDVTSPIPKSPASDNLSANLPAQTLGKSGPLHIRFQDEITFTSYMRNKTGNFKYDSKLAVVLNMTGRFLLDLRDSNMETGDSYVSILNSHIDVFDLIECDRLEGRLSSLCAKVKVKHRELQIKGSKTQREKHLINVKQVSVMRSEIENIADVDFDSFLTPEPSLTSQDLSDMGLEMDWLESTSELSALDNSPDPADGGMDLEMTVENIKQGKDSILHLSSVTQKRSPKALVGVLPKEGFMPILPLV